MKDFTQVIVAKAFFLPANYDGMYRSINFVPSNFTETFLRFGFKSGKNMLEEMPRLSSLSNLCELIC